MKSFLQYCTVVLSSCYKALITFILFSAALDLGKIELNKLSELWKPKSLKSTINDQQFWRRIITLDKLNAQRLKSGSKVELVISQKLLAVSCTPFYLYQKEKCILTSRYLKKEKLNIHIFLTIVIIFQRIIWMIR